MTQVNNRFTPGFGCGKFRGDFFSGAKPNPDSLVARLSATTSVALLGIGKIGKSSLLAETRERLRAMGTEVIWINCDFNDTPAKALTAILTSMQAGESKGIITGLKDWTERTEMIPAELKTTVGALDSGAFDSSLKVVDEKYVDVLFRQTGNLLEAQKAGNKPIIIFDELTTLIKTTIDNAKAEKTRRTVRKLNSFLGQLRYWRTDEVGIRMAVSGSVSFNWLKREYGIRSDSINDCVRVNIEEMDRDGAEELLNMCIDANSVQKWTKKLTTELLDFLPAFYPGVIQLAFDVIFSASKPIETLNTPIQKKILSALWYHYYSQFDTRFRRYGSSERRRIKKLFDAMKGQENGSLNTKEVHTILEGPNLADNEPDAMEIISNLQSDSFIDTIPGGVRFSSGLVPRWRNYREIR